MLKLNTLIPKLSVSDINRSLHFYIDILLFELQCEQKIDKLALISLGNSQIMVEEIMIDLETENIFYPFGRGINFQIIVDNINELYENIRINDYPIKTKTHENWYKTNNKLIEQNEFSIIDPDGYTLTFAQNIEREYKMNVLKEIEKCETIVMENPIKIIVYKISNKIAEYYALASFQNNGVFQKCDGVGETVEKAKINCETVVQLDIILKRKTPLLYKYSKA